MRHTMTELRRVIFGFPANKTHAHRNVREKTDRKKKNNNKIKTVYIIIVDNNIVHHHSVTRAAV